MKSRKIFLITCALSWFASASATPLKYNQCDELVRKIVSPQNASAFFMGVAHASECDGADTAFNLKRLSSLGKLHNCYVEIIDRDFGSYIHFEIYLQGLMPLQDGSRMPVVFGFKVPSSCLKGHDPVNLPGSVIDHSIGFFNGKVDFKSAIHIEVNNGGFPEKMMFQEIDLKSGFVEQKVDCSYELGDL